MSMIYSFIPKTVLSCWLDWEHTCVNQFAGGSEWTGNDFLYREPDLEDILHPAHQILNYGINYAKEKAVWPRSFLF